MRTTGILCAAALLLAAPAAAQKRKGKSAAGKPAAGAWAKAPGLYARFDTTLGTFVCQLLEQESPETVKNFVALAVGEREYTDPKDGEPRKGRFYDGLSFHRVVPDYIIQGGDPKGDSTGGPGYEFDDEINGLKFDRPGRLAMANSGPNTNGSQFFVTVIPVEQLDDQTAADGTVTSHYTIFGQVVEGQKVVDGISRVKAEGEKPEVPVLMQRVEVLRVDRKGRVAPAGGKAAKATTAPAAKEATEATEKEPVAKPVRKPRRKGGRRKAPVQKPAPAAASEPAAPEQPKTDAAPEKAPAEGGPVEGSP